MTVVGHDLTAVSCIFLQGWTPLPCDESYRVINHSLTFSTMSSTMKTAVISDSGKHGFSSNPSKAARLGVCNCMSCQDIRPPPPLPSRVGSVDSATRRS